ncbi:DUF3667 domain-containing protein [Tenacibaculum jejuense]|uniref:DUF3667 domain-containing protein n=1 Tax=Tenacibaculum jejuense TaxID=584609 RepID=A0A238UEC9_9FLAO|nr:DUF3667 domain-containing protein [Tenacibaculum jejuense]SNR16938.1 membrane protein of unknown function [Tenacibaculum jejuense]
MICISCGHDHNEKFCPNCGEKRDVQKITFQSLLKTSIHGMIEMDKGFLLNVKELFLSPKTIIEEYIQGRRKGIFNPLSYLIIITTAFIILETYLKGNGGIKVSPLIEQNHLYSLSYKTGAFIRKYLKFFWVLCIFPYAFFNRLFLKKYNFWEHLAIAAFSFGQASLIGLITFILFRITLLLNPFVYLTLFLLNYSIFYDKKNKTESILLLITSMLFYLISFLSIIVSLAYLIKHSPIN